MKHVNSFTSSCSSVRWCPHSKLLHASFTEDFRWRVLFWLGTSTLLSNAAKRTTDRDKEPVCSSHWFTGLFHLFWLIILFPCVGNKSLFLVQRCVITGALQLRPSQLKSQQLLAASGWIHHRAVQKHGRGKYMSHPATVQVMPTALKPACHQHASP